MKNSKSVLLVLTLILLGSLFITCQKESNAPIATDSEVAFAINISHTKSASTLKRAMAYDLINADRIILTIQSCDGSPTKYTSSEVKIQQMNGNYFTKKIVLKTGCYKLTEFLVLNAADSTIFAAPLAGSQEAQNVSSPLPITFSVIKNITTPVSVEVLSTENKKPEDFGLNSFPIIEVKTFGFMIGVTDKENSNLLSAKLTVSNGAYSYVQNLDSILNNIVTIKDSLSSYTLTVEKDGYKTYTHTYSLDSLKMFKNDVGNLPLLVELINSPTQLTLSDWTITTPLNTPLSSSASEVYNGYIYLIGGSTIGGTRLNNVQYVSIKPDGSLGNWQSTTSFNTPRSNHTSAVYNGYLYVIGGFAPTYGSVLNDVQYAHINPDGSLGDWQNTTSFSTSRGCFTSVVYDGYLYVMQGFLYSAASPLTDIQYAKFNADGSLGTWQSTTSYSPARWGHSSIAYNGYIYSMGGSNWNGNYYTLSDVQYTSINANGSLNNWQNTTTLNPSLNGNGFVEYNGFFLIVGGASSSIPNNGYLNSVKSVKINFDGSLGNWHDLTPFNTSRGGHNTVIYNGNLYVIGGSDNNGTVLNDVQYAKIR